MRMWVKVGIPLNNYEYLRYHKVRNSRIVLFFLGGGGNNIQYASILKSEISRLEAKGES